MYNTLTTYSHVLDGEIKAIAANWCLIVRTWGIQKVCLRLKRIHRNVDKKIFLKIQILKKKIMMWGNTLLHYKTKNEN